jgi:hypothetical protein
MQEHLKPKAKFISYLKTSILLLCYDFYYYVYSILNQFWLGLTFKPKIASKHKNKACILKVIRIGPTKTQGIVHEQQMRYTNHTKVPRPHRESWEKTPINSCSKHFAKGLYNNNEQEMRQRISLSQPTGAIEETGWIAIQNGEVYRRDAMHYPRAQFLPKSAPSQQIQ